MENPAYVLEVPSNHGYAAPRVRSLGYNQGYKPYNVAYNPCNHGYLPVTNWGSTSKYPHSCWMLHYYTLHHVLARVSRTLFASPSHHIGAPHTPSSRRPEGRNRCCAADNTRALVRWTSQRTNAQYYQRRIQPNALQISGITLTAIAKAWHYICWYNSRQCLARFITSVNVTSKKNGRWSPSL